MFFVTTKGKHIYSEPEYKKMDEIFKDLSYVTGKKCGIDMPLKYFEE